jgi:hypothetical protein
VERLGHSTIISAEIPSGAASMRQHSGPLFRLVHGSARFCGWSIVALAVTACNDDASDLDINKESVIMYGRITNDAGAAVAGARVTVSQHVGLCSLRSVEDGSATTGADGRYRVLLSMWPMDISCVHFLFQASSHVTQEASRNDVQYNDEEVPPDSVETNAVLRRS